MRLRQWYCNGPHENEYVFTPAQCDSDTALAIAWATFGRARVGNVVDEGLFNQESQSECEDFINDLAAEEQERFEQDRLEESNQGPQTLADVGMCEGDFR